MSVAAHTAIFELEGAKAQIIECSYSFSRRTDEKKGQPITVVMAGTIKVKIRSDEKEMVGKIVNAILKQDEAIKGSISIYSDAGQSAELKKIEFENGFVIRYFEEFGAENSENTLETFEITAEKIKVSGASYNGRWPNS